MFHSHIISIFFYLSPNRTWNFVTKIFLFRLFPIITGHGTENVLLMKFEILGLVDGAILPKKKMTLPYLTRRPRPSWFLLAQCTFVLLFLTVTHPAVPFRWLVTDLNIMIFNASLPGAINSLFYWKFCEYPALIYWVKIPQLSPPTWSTCS